jgi:2-aminoadipate transaminase
MSRGRREKLVALAAQYGFIIVEDSPYRRIRFDQGVAEPTLKSLDRTDSVYMLGTFSKLMAPGLRIGWVVAPPEAIARMAQLKSDGGTCPLTQRMIIEFCSRGLLDAHVARLCATYREHRDRMLAALRRELPQVKVLTPGGGYYLWLELPAGVDSEALASRAMQLGVSILAGSRFYATGAEAGTRFIDAAKRHVRLAHTFATIDEIDQGVAKLAAAYAELR